MSRHEATLSWSRGERGFGYEEYPRDHTWRFEGGPEVTATAAPDYKGNPGRVDPEEAFVAAVASCHMLTFLYVAYREGFEVVSYEDDAVGTMTKNERGVLWVSSVVLAPRIEYGEERAPSAEQEAHLHHRAHEECYIANSVKTEITVRAAREASAPARH